MWLARDIPISQGIFPLTHMVWPQSDGGKQKDNYQNISEPTGASQVQIPVRSQLSHKLYQSQRVPEKVDLHTKIVRVSAHKDTQGVGST